jgi:hypothetical protein
MWFNISAAAGNSNAIENRDTAAKLMTISQIAEAQQLARKWWNTITSGDVPAQNQEKQSINSKEPLSEEKEWKYKQWEVSIDETGMVEYFTHGIVRWGNQFGFTKKRGQCDINNIWLTLATEGDEDTSQLSGSKVAFNVKVDDKKIRLYIPILAVTELTPSMKIVLFTNTFVSKQFIDLLKKGREISFTMVGPPEVEKTFDTRYESFELDGFIANNLKARAACENSDVMDIPPHDNESK